MKPTVRIAIGIDIPIAIFEFSFRALLPALL